MNFSTVPPAPNATQLPEAFDPLRPYAQWFIYKLFNRDEQTGKYEKLNLDARTGLHPGIGAGGINQCADLDTAAGMLQRLRATAPEGTLYTLGFWLTDADPFAFLDIDKCDPDGDVARGLLAMFPNAARERSSSGRGWHIIGSATVPRHGNTRSIPGADLELYTEGRGIALTFADASGSAAADDSAMFTALAVQHFPPTTEGADVELGDDDGRDGEYIERARAIVERHDAATAADPSGADYAAACELVALTDDGPRAARLLCALSTNPKFVDRGPYLSARAVGSAMAEHLALRSQFGKQPLPPGASSTPLAPTPLGFVRASELASDKPPEYLVDGLIEVGVVGTAIAPRKSGKTFAVLDLCWAVAQGRTWGGCRVLRPGPTAWIAAEGVRSLKTRRLPAILAKYGDADVRVLPRTIELLTNIEALIRELRGCALICIDSLRRVSGTANENDNTEMSLIVSAGERLANETGAAVLFIAHASLKSVDVTATRGATSVDDVVELALNIEKDPADGSLFHIRQGFARDEGEWEGASFRLVPSAQSCVVEWLGGAAPSRSAAAGKRNRISPEQHEVAAMVRMHGGRIDRTSLVGALSSARKDRKKSSIERSITNAINNRLVEISTDDEIYVNSVAPLRTDKSPITPLSTDNLHR